MSEDTKNLMIRPAPARRDPIEVDPNDPRAVQAASLRGDWQQTMVGRVSQGEVEESRLKEELSLLEQQAADLKRRGINLSEQQQRALDGKRASYEWQRERNALNREGQETSGGAPLDPASVIGKQLDDAYEANYRHAVWLVTRDEQRRGIRVTAKEASEIVEARIARDGLEAVLPQYASMLKRHSE